MTQDLALNVTSIDERMVELVEMVEQALRAEETDGPCCAFTGLVRYANRLDDEDEKLFYLLLVTLFDDPQFAWQLYSDQGLTWQRLLTTKNVDLSILVSAFLETRRKFGDHRKYFQCLGTAQAKTEFVVEILESYRNVVRNCGAQASFFGIGQNPTFDSIFNRMKMIKHFVTVHRSESGAAEAVMI